MKHGELVHTETDERGIEYRLYIQQDDQEVRGNASAWDDEAENKAYEDAIIERLDSGDVWAWAVVTVEARYKDFSGLDNLGACCYENTAAFITPDGYWPDMKAESYSDLLNALRAARDSGMVAAGLLVELNGGL